MIQPEQADVMNVHGDHRAWREIVCDVLIDLDFEVGSEMPFHGSMRLRDLRETRILDVRATAHQVSRDKSRIRKSGDDYILLSRMMSGSGRIAQHGREAELKPGDFAIYDSTVPYAIKLDRPFEMNVVRIERDRFSHLVRDIDSLTAMPVRGDTGTGRIASLLIGAVAKEIDAIGDLTARQMHDTMLGTVAAALTELQAGGGTRPISEPRHLLMQRALSLVEEELGNEDLSCEFVSRRIGISGRYLRRLFADQGRSLSDTIWERRLLAAHRKLAAQTGVQRSITSIAFECGFKDSAHFSRAFRSRFGISPRDLRSKF